MIRRTRALALFVVSIAALCSAGDLADQWRSWRYSRVIQFPDAPRVKLSVPLEIYAHLESFTELRVIDDLGHETPFLCYDQNVRSPIETRNAVLRENSFVPGKYTQLVMDVGDRAAFHNAAEIETPQTDFINWVEIAASDDARTWRIVKQRAPISNFRNENIVGNRLVRYSDNNARFLRIRILEPGRQFPVSSVTVQFSREFQEQPVRMAVPLPLTAGAESKSTATRWTIDLQSQPFPVSGVEIDTTQPEFFRVVHMQTSNDAREWQYYFTGQIYRYKQGDKQTEDLRVYSHEGWHHRFWRIEVVNGNDAPLSDAKPSLLTIPYFVVFNTQAGRSYRLLYGNGQATSALYDLARTFDYSTVPNIPLATAGSEELTANYRDSRPFSERHPVVLWIALLAAVALLGWSAFRALRAPTTAPS
jgi:Protein of unknown function (DUF3999)